MLTQGNSLKSQSKAVTLRLQEDGNLVLSCLNSPIWSSNTHGNTDIKSLDFQDNGNLVLIKKDNSFAWSTNVQNSKGTHLVLQNDGNLVLLDNGNKSIWTSRTEGKCDKVSITAIYCQIHLNLVVNPLSKNGTLITS